eukprot:scaffold222957_cov35-Prasinocladus_malaysianus.AAC.1
MNVQPDAQTSWQMYTLYAWLTTTGVIHTFLSLIAMTTDSCEYNTSHRVSKCSAAAYQRQMPRPSLQLM